MCVFVLELRIMSAFLSFIGDALNLGKDFLGGAEKAGGSALRSGEVVLSDAGKVAVEAAGGFTADVLSNASNFADGAGFEKMTSAIRNMTPEQMTAIAKMGSKLAPAEMQEGLDMFTNVLGSSAKAGDKVLSKWARLKSLLIKGAVYTGVGVASYEIGKGDDDDDDGGNQTTGDVSSGNYYGYKAGDVKDLIDEVGGLLGDAYTSATKVAETVKKRARVATNPSGVATTALRVAANASGVTTTAQRVRAAAASAKRVRRGSRDH